MVVVNRLGKLCAIALFCAFLGGCMVENHSQAQEERGGQGRPSNPSVDAVRVNREALEEAQEYIGTTQPVREIVVRSQAEGQLLSLTVDVGDTITQGQTIARLDDNILRSALTRAEGELSSLRAERLSAVAEINNAQSQVESARVRLQQAQADVNRFEELNREGAIARRELEVAQTEERTALQEVSSAQSQVRVRESAVSAIDGRIQSQEAIIAEARQRLNQTQITAGSAGRVLERLTEPGNLVQPGGEILRIGDFSQVKVQISVSELDLSDFSVGRPVNVSLDAFPTQTFSGIVSTISPSADGRQIPVEITLDNNGVSLNGGLLARVSLADNRTPPIVIPQNALNVGGDDENNPTVFVLDDSSGEPSVIARAIVVGENRNGRVEVTQGLTESDRLIVRSTQPLENGQTVSLSMISDD
ncbi:efflux transporter, RND family, MFP subunit [Cyanobacterium stanieri PCC 7202]|uniref:Efflux transporter, RND family, MFP subunit n=1 Tax=Cyanobacterium stanieri (strain ATCC 29140 / PCC 7202) TaxID=292563 RepID=K9YNC1_CYASC|nr:efflux transporter, RND family, MFP subunit [Cyanobacterium stanieri PCC 7202]